MSRYLIPKLLIIIGLAFSQSASAQSNAGTEFWLSFMEHIDSRDNRMVVMVTATRRTTGVVSIPLLNFSQNFTVEANDVVLVSMPAVAETIGSESISNNAIHVTSQNPVSVYMHQYHGFRSEATVVLPVTSLSTEYYIMSYTGIDAFFGSGTSEFLIVGIEDETSITFTVTDNTSNGLTAGESQTIMLNKGQTFQVKAPSSSDDLTGSFISGDKVFNVFGGASWSGVPRSCGTYDNLLEQMNPIVTWGSRYVTIPTQTNNNDVFRILSATDNNEIRITNLDGSIQDYTLDKGGFIEYQRRTPTFIEAVNPVMVAQYLIGRECTSNSEGDPSMVILNSVEQIRDTITMYNSRFQDIRQNYISIIGRTADIDNVTLDGAAITSPWTAIGLTGEFSFVTLLVGVGSHTIISAGCGVIASAFGLGDAESYAYAGGASFNRINANPIPDGECVGVPLLFQSGLPPGRYEVEWDVGHNSFSTTEHEFEYMYPQIDAEYNVNVTIHDLCFNETSMQEKEVKITFRQNVTTGPDISAICQGETLQLDVSDLLDANYIWTGPQNFESEDQTAIIDNIEPNMSGVYEVTGVVFGCKTPTESITVDIKPTPQPNLGLDSVFCKRLGIPAIISPGDWRSYNWSDGSASPNLSIREAGDYTVTVTDLFNCVGTDSISFEPRCPTSFYIPTAFTPNGDFTNDEFTVEGFDVLTMKLVIFDRWGNEVFMTTDHEDDWDGSYNGMPVANGNYAWVIQFTGYDEEGNEIEDQKQGVVQLMR